MIRPITPGDAHQDLLTRFTQSAAPRDEHEQRECDRELSHRVLLRSLLAVCKCH